MPHCGSTIYTVALVHYSVVGLWHLAEYVSICTTGDQAISVGSAPAMQAM